MRARKFKQLTRVSTQDCLTDYSFSSRHTLSLMTPVRLHTFLQEVPQENDNDVS